MKILLVEDEMRMSEDWAMSFGREVKHLSLSKWIQPFV
jgi:hypothetical protein